MSELSTTPSTPATPDPAGERAGAAGPGPAGLSSRRLVVAGLVTLLTGVGSGLVWLWLADPARWEAREGGIVLTEAGSRGQFQVIVVFTAIGILASVLGGGTLVRALPGLGWLSVPLVVVLTTIASLVAWRVGVELGPPPPESVSGLSVGDTVPDQLAIDGLAPFLVWPIFGLVGVLAATWTVARRGL